MQIIILHEDNRCEKRDFQHITPELLNDLEEFVAGLQPAKIGDLLTDASLAVAKNQIAYSAEEFEEIMQPLRNITRRLG